MKMLTSAYLLISMTTGAHTYPIIDTGQTTTYGDYKGQDAHYQGNAPS